jgi:hypothetical protein
MVVVNVFSCKKGVGKYKPLNMQMWANQDACDVANANVIALLDVWILLDFHCFLHLLELFHGVY